MDYTEIENSFNFDSKFSSGREACYFGQYDYRYGGRAHKARPFEDNEMLTRISNQVRSLCPNVDFNSVLIHMYCSGDDHIAPHSDNEPNIDCDSSIITVSFGDTRTMKFRKKSPPFTNTDITLSQGEIMIMTRESQDKFDHQICKEPNRTGRISFTYRLLKPSPPRSSKAHKIQILTGSRNETFDCSLFKNDLVCFSESMYTLRDLGAHRNSIGQADYVLISSGINDLVQLRTPVHVLTSHMEQFAKKAAIYHPNTSILFESISPIALRADPTGFINRQINTFNNKMFELSLTQDNFKLFDSLNLGLAHLSRDGIHYTDQGKVVASKTWVHAVLTRLGYRKGSLPIRPDFVNRNEFFQNRVNFSFG